MSQITHDARPTPLTAPGGQSDWVRSGLRHEFKYLGADWEAALARARLEAACRPDPQYPVNRVHSLYFDTWRLQDLDSKRNGDTRKTKVRLRWYATLGQPGTLPGRAWLEIKRREGAMGRKDRLAVTLDLAGAATPPAADLARWVQELLGRPLQPVCWMSYRRHRYLTSPRHQRVALDDDVRAHWIAPWTLLPVRPLPHYVLEVKGPDDQLDPALARAVGPMVHRSGFSKYAWVLEGDIAA